MTEELDDLSVLDDLDIPEVMRDAPEQDFSATKNKGLSPWLLMGIASFVLISVGAIAVWQILLERSQPASVSANSSEVIVTPTNPEDVSSNAEIAPDNLLGHFAYEEAPAADLKAMTADGRLKLRPVAAQKYEEMRGAARQSGINLLLISGFRSIKEQEYLFFEVKEQRAQDTSKRAEVSAPPRHSEHHTGYAVDIGDRNVPATNLSPSFEKTAAFRWLQNNAARYSFELSFPRDNDQGIAYEPWHWRVVGDQDSLETFYKSRNSSETTESL